MSTATRTNPKLWEQVKASVKRGVRGGVANTWTARKAQLAVALYKQRGGGYIGRKQASNSLVRWTRQQWDYITPGKRRGRYLPLAVRKQLTPAERKTENKKKGARFGHRVPYSPSVRRKVHKATAASK